MAVVRRRLPDAEFIPYLLVGLRPNYDALVSSIATRLEPIPSTELLGHLLAHEAWMLHHTDKNISLMNPLLITWQKINLLNVITKITGAITPIKTVAMATPIEILWDSNR